MRIISNRNVKQDPHIYDIAKECVEKMINDYYEDKAFWADLDISGLEIMDPVITYQDADLIQMEVPVKGPRGTYNQEVDLDNEGDGWYAPMLTYDLALFTDLMDESGYWKGFKKILDWATD